MRKRKSIVCSFGKQEWKTTCACTSVCRCVPSIQPKELEMNLLDLNCAALELSCCFLATCHTYNPNGTFDYGTVRNAAGVTFHNGTNAGATGAKRMS